MELWTILDWTNPGAMGTQSGWRTYVVVPLTHGQSKNATGLETVVSNVSFTHFNDSNTDIFFSKASSASFDYQGVTQVLFEEVSKTRSVYLTLNET